MELTTVKELVKEQKFKEALSTLCDTDYNRLSIPELRNLNAVLQEIPMELRSKSGIHITQQCYICKMLGDHTGFEQWYNMLVTLRDGVRGGSGERDSLENCISRVNVMRAKTNNAQTLILLSTLSNDGETGLKAIGINATAKRPSVLRGNKDCSEWGKYYKAVRSILLPVLSTLTGFDGKGAVELAVGEICLERGDFNGAVMSLGVAVNSEQADIRFAARCVLARLYMLEGDTEKSSEMMLLAENIVKDGELSWLEPSLAATIADMAICTGDKNAVEAWRAGLEDFYKDKVLPDTEYVNIIRAKAMMSAGEWRDAAMLLQGLINYFDELSRALDSIECRVLCALSLMQMDDDDKAVEMLGDAIEMARPYSYTTVFADKGKLMFRLLGKYEKMTGEGSSRYYETISAQTRAVSLKLPSKFDFISGIEESPSGPPELTDMELRILQMIDEGASNKSIGVDLQIKLTTVKFHIKNIFEKFDVASRVELLKKARMYKMLS